MARVHLDIGLRVNTDVSDAECAVEPGYPSPIEGYGEQVLPELGCERDLVIEALCTLVRDLRKRVADLEDRNRPDTY